MARTKDLKHRFGGYTSVSWSDVGGLIQDDTAFVFSYSDNLEECKIFNVTPGEYAVRHSKVSGPSFGMDLYFSFNGNEFDMKNSNLDNLG